MDKAEPEKLPRMITRSSIKRKPFSDLTNHTPKPYHHSPPFTQPQKPKSVSSISSSSIGSTQNSIYVQTPIPVHLDLPSTAHNSNPDHWVGDKDHIAHSQRKTTEETRNNEKEISAPLVCSPSKNISICEKGIVVHFNAPSTEKKRKGGKQISKPLSCYTVDKTKGKRKARAATVYQPSLERARYEGKERPVARSCSMRNTINTIKDKEKAILVPVNQPSLEKIRNDEEISVALHCSSEENVKGKPKAIAAPLNCHLMEKATNNRDGISLPLSGVKIAVKGVASSCLVDPAKRDEVKAVATPISNHALEKKVEGISCPPLLRTRSNRDEVDGREDIIQTKSQTDPPPYKKKRKYSSKGGVEEHVLPQDFIDQQKAYFKEIDEFELPVEEV